MAGKLQPKKYGEKVTQEHVGEGGGPIKSSIEVVFIEPGEGQ